MIKKYILLILCTILLFSISYAHEDLALNYNILPDVKDNSVIDINIQRQLDFRLFQEQSDVIYYNGESIFIDNLRFSIDISSLSGKQVFHFSNDKGETKDFTYYISDKTGLVCGYTLAMTSNVKVFVQTLDSTKIIYTEKESSQIPDVIELLAKMPEETKLNLNEIILFPIAHGSGAAGITDYNKVKLYELSSYTDSEVERIIFHEVAHTWAHSLRKNKVIDYSYTGFAKAVEEDNNYVSNYSKSLISEDFADSVAFYLTSDSFAKKHPARAEYISSLLSNNVF